MNRIRLLKFRNVHIHKWLQPEVEFASIDVGSYGFPFYDCSDGSRINICVSINNALEQALKAPWLGAPSTLHYLSRLTMLSSKRWKMLRSPGLLACCSSVSINNALEQALKV